MITEWVDDVVLLLGQMMKMGLPEIVDESASALKARGVELGPDGDDLAGVYGVNRSGSGIGLEQYGPWG